MFDSNDRFPGDSPIPAAEEPDQGQAEPLLRQYGHLDAEAMLKVMIGDVFPGRIAVTTSFGTEAAVLLDLIARVNPATPVIFLDTGVLFEETAFISPRRCRSSASNRAGARR